MSKYTENIGKAVRMAAKLDREGQHDKADEITSVLKMAAENPEMIREAGFWDYIKNIGTGAAAGAGAGFGLGTIVPGIGNVVGGIGGAIIGGLSGLGGSIVSDLRTKDLGSRLEQAVQMALLKDKNGEDGFEYLKTQIEGQNPAKVNEAIMSYLELSKRLEHQPSTSAPLSPSPSVSPSPTSGVPYKPSADRPY
jgi:hypothetical protein